MKFPRYWAKGSATTELRTRGRTTGTGTGTFSCWGWSDVSVDEAETRGRQRAAAIAAIFRTGKRPDRYLYGDRPMREELLDEWKRADASTYAAVTLNSYGCQVLNTTSIMFVDVDLAPASPWDALKTKFSRLLGNRGPSAREKQEADALAKVAAMVQADRQCGVRSYRTHGGLRHLLTHAHANPSAESTLRAMDALGADPLYVRLCKVQECFRARLNPKPWRCGAQALRIPYPWADATAAQGVRDWLGAYARKADGYATCALIQHFGATRMDDEIGRVVAFHDEATKAQSGLPLA